MAKKTGSKGSLSYDYHNLTPEQKQKLSAVCDQFPEIQRDTVAIVLDHHDFDQDKAIDALTSDGGSSALGSWKNQIESSQIKGNKNKKKNKRKNKKDGQMNNIPICYNDADDSSSLHSSNIDFEIEKESSKMEDIDGQGLKSEKDGDNCGNEHINPFDNCSEIPDSDKPLTAARIAESPEQTCRSVSSATENDSRAQHNCFDITKDDSILDVETVTEVNEEHMKYPQKYHQRQRHSSSQHSKSSSISEDTQSNQSKRGVLVKCTKDLTRQTISLQRIEMQLGNRLEEASKCLKNTFSEVHKMLDKRQADMEEQLSKVKAEALSLLRSRQIRASDLKRKVDSVMSMNESQWNELRADIKQFVTERKYDDELGKTIWFYWSMDMITEAVSKLGEVCPVKNLYSQRQNSTVSISKSVDSYAGVSSVSTESTRTSKNTADGTKLFPTCADNVKVEEKLGKDLQRSVPQNERVFCSKRYVNRYPLNKGKGYQRGRSGYSHSHQYENRQPYSGSERHNDHRKQYHHDKIEYNKSTSDKSIENQSHESGQTSTSHSTFFNNPREGYGHYERKLYPNRSRPPQKTHNYYGKSRGGSRMRFNMGTSVNSDLNSDKVVNQENQFKNQGINGF